MSNFIIVFGALIFLLVLWIFTYRNLLLHTMSEAARDEKNMRERFFILYNKLPYLLSTMSEYKVNGGDISRLRDTFVGVDLKIEEVFQNYDSLYTVIEEVATTHDKGLKSDVGFLEIKGEIEDLHDEIRLLAKAYDAKVKAFNDGMLKFPGNFVGGLFKMGSLSTLLTK